MLSSPERQCIISRQKLPSAYMINLRPTLFPPPTSKLYLLPDRILHPKSAAPKTGKGMWISNHHLVIPQLATREKSLRQRVPGLSIPSFLPEMIHDQLQQRVIQELELLKVRPERTVRRLSVDESKGLVPLRDEENIVAFLDLRKTNHEPIFPSAPAMPYYPITPLFTSPPRLVELHQSISHLLSIQRNRVRRHLLSLSPTSSEQQTTPKYPTPSSILALLSGSEVSLSLERLSMHTGKGWDTIPVLGQKGARTT
ncbi:hypothetical protein P7C73_g3017, partial [Tremellales sp. Uapishka_1]